MFQRNTNFQPNKSRSAGFICRSLFIVKAVSKPSQPNSGHDPWSSPANLISVDLQPPAAQPVCEFQPRTASQPKHQPSQPNIGHGPWSSPANLISVGLKPNFRINSQPNMSPGKLTQSAYQESASSTKLRPGAQPT